MPVEYEYSHRVTYSDCTVGNHIYYGRYLDLLEAARGGFFRQTSTSLLQWQERGFIFPVIECRLRYKHPARYDDLLAIKLRVNRAEGVRVGFGYHVFNQDAFLILEAETHHVCTSLADKLCRLPPDLRSTLQSWVRDEAAACTQ